MESVMSLAQQLATLDALADVGGALAGAKLMLYSNTIVPNKLTVLADLTPAIYTGYAPVAIPAWGSAFVGQDSRARITAPGHQFNPTGTAQEDTVRGWGITNTAGTVLIIAKNFDQPVGMDGPTTGVIAVPTYAYGD